MFDLIFSLFPIVFHLILAHLEGSSTKSNHAGIPSPILKQEFKCGSKTELTWHYGEINGTELPPYYLNKTAIELEAQGFEIKVEEMIDDAIFNFTYTNGTCTQYLAFEDLGSVAAVGGEPALRQRAYYMAQLGIRRREKIHWVCDGVLINRGWVLSAAHCFVGDKPTPNMLRLGDYDVSVPPEQGLDALGKFVEDYYIHDVLFHPEYTGDEWYHDLVLIPLERPMPMLYFNINPICLPWGPPLDLLGKNVTLTGWGATEFGGPKTPLLQEVGLQVFNTSFCNDSYSGIPNFRSRYPNGLSSQETLCAGWPEGGKDACGGDSGAPLVYDLEESIVLIGIVASGFGCGKKDFPGLYVPITEPIYLQWINDVTFKNNP